MRFSNTSPMSALFFNFDRFRFRIVALIFLTSFFVKVEPAPTDLLGILAICLFATSGLHVSRYFASPLLFLVLFIVSGLISTAYMSTPITYTKQPYMYAVGIAYIAATGFFIASFLTINTFERFRLIEKNYIIAAVIGAILSFLLLMRVEPFISFFLALPGTNWDNYNARAVGGFKDPNVFSTWLMLPAILMTHGFIIGRIKLTLFKFIGYMLILGALFLAYSRGAWIDFVASSIMVMFLTFILSPSSGLRTRVILVSSIGVGVLFLALAFLLTIPTVSMMFFDRFTLIKEYDGGETGRFGDQLNSIPYLLTHPFGYGPLRYADFFGQAPHNTFINSFASGGWLGGISYIMLLLITCYMGFKAVFTRSPYQVLAIPIFSTYFIMSLQGIQIDNDHWRHIYWMMGMIWALYAVIMEHGAEGYTEEEIAAGWGLKWDDMDEIDSNARH